MRDVFIAHCHQDQVFALSLARALAGRGLEIGRAVEIWPHMRVLKFIDAGLVDIRHAVLIVSRDFLKLNIGRKDLDILAGRRAVVSILYGVTEENVAGESPKLAISAIQGEMAEHLVRLLRSDSSYETG